LETIPEHAIRGDAGQRQVLLTKHRCLRIDARANGIACPASILAEAYPHRPLEYARPGVGSSLDTSSLTADERRLVARLTPALQRELNATSVWLYESRARGEPVHADSDIDLLVIAPGSSWDNRNALAGSVA